MTRDCEAVLARVNPRNACEQLACRDHRCGVAPVKCDHGACVNATGCPAPPRAAKQHVDPFAKQKVVRAAPEKSPPRGKVLERHVKSAPRAEPHTTVGAPRRPKTARAAGGQAGEFHLQWGESPVPDEGSGNQSATIGMFVVLGCVFFIVFVFIGAIIYRSYYSKT